MSAPARMRQRRRRAVSDRRLATSRGRGQDRALGGEAAATGAELLVFPEYGAMEIAGDAAGERWRRSRRPRSRRSPTHCRASMRSMPSSPAHRVHILAGSGPRARPDGRFVNAARLYRAGGRSAVQEKLIMTPFERDWGNRRARRCNVFETALGRIGVAICYDSEFPLLVRAQVEAGAEIILIPVLHRARLGLSSRAHGGAGPRARRPDRDRRRRRPSATPPGRRRSIAISGAAGIYVPAEAGISETGVLAEGMLNAPGWVYAERRPRGVGPPCRCRRDAQPRRLAPSAGRRSHAAESGNRPADVIAARALPLLPDFL